MDEYLISVYPSVVHSWCCSIRRKSRWNVCQRQQRRRQRITLNFKKTIWYHFELLSSLWILFLRIWIDWIQKLEFKSFPRQQQLHRGRKMFRAREFQCEQIEYDIKFTAVEYHIIRGSNHKLYARTMNEL